LRELVKRSGTSLRAVVVNLEASPEIDVTSLEMLRRLRDELQESGIHLYFSRVADPVRDLFDRSGFSEELDGRLFRGVNAAVAAFLDSLQPLTRARSA
jgi:MFS superfamily sulfate permease-like transporter